MKNLLVFILLLNPCIRLKAQVNYVLNPSSEQYSHCPYTADQIKYANFWSPIDSKGNPDSPLYFPICSPEYCNTYASGTIVGVPSGGGYNHKTHSGNVIAQVQMYSNETEVIFYIRDYLQGRFVKPLIADTTYCVTFYVALEQLSNYAINNIGVYIDNGGIDIASDTGCAQPHSLITPQILDSNVINDTVNWKMIQGLIKANGIEKFIAIGNFSDKNHITAIPLSYSSSNFSRYLVDDVSVIESNTDSNAGNDTTNGYGDTAHIGIYEGGMPCTWYIEGNNTPIILRVWNAEGKDIFNKQLLFSQNNCALNLKNIDSIIHIL
jgi:hypothetical protein